MTLEQALSMVRWVLTTIGPLLIAHGYLNDTSWTAVSGAVISLVPLVWGIATHRQTALIAKVAAMPDVKKVVATDQIANVTLKDNEKVTTV
jgi:hypothetical protein